ncbi:hypothetical protein [Microbacterium album]|uniref:Uncharacterized protein n=1 Tax=Microbacterium album TaxID=2053191 RepID=A0A917IB50_9MICO|nr:hypothetical protein [Microbacterium album]GGH33984.1 hypothetical protein GCM10010921_01340 [Microbacterium album]
MSAVVDAPVVRTEDGAILGPDWRRAGLARPEYTVPGRIPADGVQPGDTIRVLDMDLVVLKVWRDRPPFAAGIRVLARTVRGAELVFEYAERDMVDVVAVGAFDR